MSSTSGKIFVIFRSANTELNQAKPEKNLSTLPGGVCFDQLKTS